MPARKLRGERTYRFALRLRFRRNRPGRKIENVSCLLICKPKTQREWLSYEKQKWFDKTDSWRNLIRKHYSAPTTEVFISVDDFQALICRKPHRRSVIGSVGDDPSCSAFERKQNILFESL